MRFNLKPKFNHSRPIGSLISLVALVVTVASVHLGFMLQKVQLQEYELSHLLAEIGFGQAAINHEQMLLQIDSSRREQKQMVDRIKVKQQSISHAFTKLLYWLPTEVVINGLSSDASGRMSINASSFSLSAVATFLSRIHNDEQYLVLSVSPLTYRGENYGFSLSVLPSDSIGFGLPPSSKGDSSPLEDPP